MLHFSPPCGVDAPQGPMQPPMLCADPAPAANLAYAHSTTRLSRDGPGLLCFAVAPPMPFPFSPSRPLGRVPQHSDGACKLWGSE